MEPLIAKYLDSLNLAEPQFFRNMSLFPLMQPENHGPRYLALSEALEFGLLTITEIVHGGSVPELAAVNRGDLPVLLLDGEELSGAKQNRVLNATILLKAHSETVIPVSCTEHGRWDYKSAEFADSDLIMSRNIRQRKAQTVTDSLRTRHGFKSDQGQIWEDISEMACDFHVDSPTGAMKDVFESKTETLEEYLKAFPLLTGQAGLLVAINGIVAGFDVLSLESAYARLHKKLVKSYAIDAFSEEAPEMKEEAHQKALSFLKGLKMCKEERFASVGLGFDYRFQSPVSVGSALVFQERVIHGAFFALAGTRHNESMSGYRQRRKNRL